MKKTVTIFLLICCFFMNTAASASIILEYDGSVHNYTGAVYSLEVNGKKLTNLPLEPIIFNDRALVPVREVFEALGAKVDYEDSDKSIDITYGKQSVLLQIGNTQAAVNGVKTTIPDGAFPRLIAKWGESAKTMVPVRFISESVGLDVNFDGQAGLISVSDGSAAQPDETPKPSAVKLNKIEYSQNGNVVTVRVSASGSISGISKGAVTASNVLYVDVSNASYTTANKTEVNLGAVTAVRMGLHDSSTRIAIDTQSMKKYSVSLSEDGRAVVFMISSDESANVSQPSPAPTATPKPTASPSPSTKPTLPNGEKIVVIDAGHGGSDPGASGSLMNNEEMAAYKAALETTEPILETMSAGSGKTYKEKDIALTVAKKVQKNLEAKGIRVIMTRTGDTYPTLDERPELANSAGAVIFLSIHLNSTTAAVTAANGIEIYYSEQNNGSDYGITSKEMADIILKSTVNSTDAKSRGVKSGNLLVTRKSNMPANLIEIGFMNNPQELEKLISDSYQESIASGIAKGILTALGKIDLQ
ncbi:MAG: N-acetylmuramoyl-L-alanine amidase [Clostridiales bacterium]|nr:N-acetylmuramoyl-L-alanine amidase [Clostridiales bacterium]